MIGKALSKNEMRKLVNHMGEIDQPWVNIVNIKVAGDSLNSHPSWLWNRISQLQ